MRILYMRRLLNREGGDLVASRWGVLRVRYMSISFRMRQTHVSGTMHIYAGLGRAHSRISLARPGLLSSPHGLASTVTGLGMSTTSIHSWKVRAIA